MRVELALLNQKLSLRIYRSGFFCYQKSREGGGKFFATRRSLQWMLAQEADSEPFVVEPGNPKRGLSPKKGAP